MAPLAQVWAYLKVGAVNALFGYACFAALIFLGVGPFAAQLTSHLIGMAFNYFMFRRHVFKNSERSVFRFILAYAVNYLLGLGVLAALKEVIQSDYVAGFLTIAIVAGVNFFVLKFAVFRCKAANQ